MSVLHGVGGHLLASSFIVDTLARAPLGPHEDQARRRLAAWRIGCQTLGPASTPRAVLQAAGVSLACLLGFDRPGQVEVADNAAEATLRFADRPCALVVSTWSGPLDALWRTAVTAAHARGADWCLLFDGRRMRIVDATRLYSRRHLEFDLDLAADDPRTFAALWRSCHGRLVTGDAADPLSLRSLVAASDRHAAGVCRSLRAGVLTASTEILRALVSRNRVTQKQNAPLTDALEQALTIVYRILFLLFAEARALVPLWHPIYRESYSIESLRDAAEQAHVKGLWDALRAIGRLAHAGCCAGDLRVTPFNGRLFAPGRTPLADRRDLDEGAARRAVVALSTRPAADRSGRERVAYRDLGVEQLGAVYETLLDYQPRWNGEAVALAPGSGVRKETGTFYTPQPIADYLVRRTLDPLVHDADPERILQLRIVDPSMGSGAFLVAACRFLARAYEAALVRAGACHQHDIEESDRALFRRTVAERCLYGVDLNPMAVQLARLSLWLATLAADRPLSFLDHRLQVGDSLLGAWVAALRRPPARRRRAGSGTPMPLFDEDAMSTALRDTLPLRFSLETTPNDTIDQVRAKERAFTSLIGDDAPLSRWKRVANLWCAAWFASPDEAPPAAAFGALSDAALTGRSALPHATAQRYIEAAARTARVRRLFHWELEYPEVFFEADGRRRARPGFDAVIGNPPWEMIRADAGGGDARARARMTIAPALRFTRDSGTYAAQSSGHANLYQLFVERAVALTREGGRFGLVLPSGLGIDHGSASLRRMVLARCDVDAIVGMDNHRGVFPIHRSVRFLLVTATAGSPTRDMACRLGIDDPAALESIGSHASEAPEMLPIRLSPAALRRISGDALAIPHLRAPVDLDIVERAASLFPPLGSDAGWRARFGRELNATDDRQVLRSGGNGLPVIDGRHIEPFRVRLEAIERSIRPADARRRLRLEPYAHARLAYRDVASATNRLTLIAAVLPSGCVSTHTVFCLRTDLPRSVHQFLCGIFNSFAVNYLVRMRVSTHVTSATVEQLPIPTEACAPDAFREIAALAGALARAHDGTALSRLNARVAMLYQLSAAEYEHVLQTFPLIPIEERRAALRAFVDERR